MNRKTLDWTYFDWQQFQTLCIAIAEGIVPDGDFSDYLKLGQKQDGIDLLSFQRNEGKFYCIQCKKEKSLSKSDIKKILSEFLNGFYADKSSDFVIATSANLQNSNLQKYINEERFELFNSRNLNFECWDVSVIEKHLRNRWGLVSRYFGRLQAEEFCNPQIMYENFQQIPLLENYIPRKLSQLNFSKDDDFNSWKSQPLEKFDLLKIIKDNRENVNKICIVGDAYQGKSSYINHCINELRSSDLRFQPVFIQIKDYNVQPIEELLQKIYGDWKTIPSKDIIVIIDGLDEVPTEKFTEAINFIKEFSENNRPVSIIFSCRKLFYAKYFVDKNLPDFNTYEIYPLEHEDVERYLGFMLNTDASIFKATVSSTGISSFLYHPFFLVTIVDLFLNSPNNLPASKQIAIDVLIERSFDIAKYRKVVGSESISNESVKFNSVIENFAFALQLSGKNSLTDVEVQKIFTTNERLLLQHNSLITHSGQSWSFLNALFQEHIAANKLSKLPFEKIASICTVGKSNKKVKTKWIQTIASLISILKPESDTYCQVLDLVENDNIELVFQADSTKFEESQQLHFLKKLIERCTSQNIRPSLIYEDTIGNFIRYSDECKNYLLQYLSNKEVKDRIKVVCCRILRYSFLNTEQLARFLEFAIDELSSVSDAYYASNIVNVLSFHKKGDERTIQRLLHFDSLNSHHIYRDSVYEYITRLGLCDKFFSYAFSGLSYLIEYNSKGVYHGGSEYNIEKFFLSLKRISNAAELIRSSQENNWIKYFLGYRGSDNKRFFKKLFEKFAENFDEYPYIIFPIAEFIKVLGKKYLREDYKEVDEFLEKTNSNWIIVRILIEELFKDNNWQVGSLITHDCYDFVLFEFEAANHDYNHLRNCFMGLRYKYKEEMANAFYNLCFAATEGAIKVESNENSLYMQYQRAEEKKLENDLIHIKSIEAFRLALKQFFKDYGKPEIPESDLYIELEGNRGNIRTSSNSNFIFYYLSKWHGETKFITLKTCLSELKNEELFESFRAEEILGYHRRSEQSDKVLLPILKEYYYANLAKANFKNCMWQDEKGFHWLRREVRLGEIFKKFEFDTPDDYLCEFIWLDSEGIRGIETARLNKSKTISELIIDKLSANGKEKLKKIILQNIRMGIKSQSVLGTHIQLCKHLGIKEAKDDILACIKNINTENFSRHDAVDIYLTLGGKKELILEVLKDETNYNSYFFEFLVLKLYKFFPREVGLVIMNAFDSPKTNYDKKVTLASILAEMGFSKGFQFLVDEVKDKHKSPHYIQGAHQISALNTSDALNKLEPLKNVLVDKEIETKYRFHESAKSILIEWLNTLASKSEDDLKLVIDYLEKAKQDLSGVYDNTTDINWYINQILENFRNSDKQLKSIEEIKIILRETE